MPDHPTHLDFPLSLLLGGLSALCRPLHGTAMIFEYPYISIDSMNDAYLILCGCLFMVEFRSGAWWLPSSLGALSSASAAGFMLLAFYPEVCS